MHKPDELPDPIKVDFDRWTANVAADPHTLAERQATEIFLAALGMTPKCAGRIFLKGGILVGAVYESGRNTADIDFSTDLKPDLGFADGLKDELEKAFPVAAAKLGYPDKIFRLQSLAFKPRKSTFVEADFPAIEVKFAYADRGTKQEKMLHAGNCSDVIYADISFNEPIETVQKVCIGDTGVYFYAYSLKDLVAEKLRSLLQQVIRNRNRRQDVYDLNYLIHNVDISSEARVDILRCFLEKCSSRRIAPTQTSLDNPEVRQRAQVEWESLASEVEELPDFDAAYDAVNAFYKSMPW